MAKDGERDGLRAPCVAQLVLHAVAQGVHGELLIGDCLTSALVGPNSSICNIADYFGCGFAVLTTVAKVCVLGHIVGRRFLTRIKSHQLKSRGPVFAMQRAAGIIFRQRNLLRSTTFLLI